MDPEAGNGKAKARRGLAGRAKEEPDAGWRAWFLEVERRRASLGKGKTVASRYEVDGTTCRIVRKSGAPRRLRAVLPALERIRKNQGIGADLQQLRDVWPDLVTPDIAAECRLHSFRGGILTVAVANSALLQELRQFHKQSLMSDLRERWPLEAPLVDVRFRAEKR